MTYNCVEWDVKPYYTIPGDNPLPRLVVLTLTDPRRGVLTLTLTLTGPRGGNYLKTHTFITHIPDPRGSRGYLWGVFSVGGYLRGELSPGVSPVIVFTGE